MILNPEQVTQWGLRGGTCWTKCLQHGKPSPPRRSGFWTPWIQDWRTPSKDSPIHGGNYFSFRKSLERQMAKRSQKEGLERKWSCMCLHCSLFHLSWPFTFLQDLHFHLNRCWHQAHSAIRMTDHLLYLILRNLADELCSELCLNFLLFWA
jgi:hypothetical protein